MYRLASGSSNMVGYVGRNWTVSENIPTEVHAARRGLLKSACGGGDGDVRRAGG